MPKTNNIALFVSISFTLYDKLRSNHNIKIIYTKLNFFVFFSYKVY